MIVGEKAHKLLNYTELLGCELHVTPYRPGGIRDKVSGNIFVKNLPADFKSKNLHELFAPYGEIFSCKVKYTNSGICKGYGYVQFDNKEAAQKALAEATGKEVKGVKIEVFPFKAREGRSSSIMMYNNLFVKCIPKKYKSDDLKALFATFGEIVSAVVIKEREDSPENKGFGFVCFKTVEQAKAAEEKMKGFSLEGQSLYVCRALSKDEHKRQMRDERRKTFKDRNVYIKGLAEEVNDETLKKAFEVFGQVLSARVMLERREDMKTSKVEMKSRCFGFVCFATKEDAAKAIAAAPQQQILGRNLYVGIAESKEERMGRFAQGPFPVNMGGFYPMPMYQQHRPRRQHVSLDFLIISIGWKAKTKTSRHGTLYVSNGPNGTDGNDAWNAYDA